ncbi:MAG: AMP-binding protein, partial [Chlorobiales bacterium]|nr:AMP-binding protein [Chlorobiales bacterium]
MDLVKDAAKRFGKHPALITPERSWSFIECERESARISSTLASLGIVSGDIVSIVAPNSPELLLLLMALLRLGAVAAPVNHRFPAIHIDGVIERLAPKLTLFDPEVCPSLTVERAITFETFETLLQASLSSKFTAAQKPDRPASIIHTSASTGMPKAAMHSVSNHWHNAVGSAMNLPFGPGECWLLSLPLYHIGGYSMLFKCLTGGGALAAAPQGINLETSLESLPVTHLSLVPTQLYRLLRTPKGAKL